MIKPAALAAILAAVAPLLTACAGHPTAPNPVFEQADIDQIPNVTNEGFYDGGVFDQDAIRLERGRPSL